jgi:hypothetical protein
MKALARRLPQAEKLWRIGFFLFVSSYFVTGTILSWPTLCNRWRIPLLGARHRTPRRCRESFIQKLRLISRRQIAGRRAMAGSRHAKFARNAPSNGPFRGSISCEWRYDGGVPILRLSSLFRTLLLSLGFLIEKTKIKPQQLGQPGQKQAS